MGVVVPGFHVAVIPSGDCVTLRLVGEVDLAAAPQIAEHGTRTLADPFASLVIIDLGEVTFLDSMGIAALLEIRHAAAEVKKRLLFTHLPPRVLKVLRLTGLDRPIPFHAHPAASCSVTDPDGGRCQLTPRHDGWHAASIGDAYMTWLDAELQAWSIHQPPNWLVDLPWAPGRQPPVGEAPAEVRT